MTGRQLDHYCYFAICCRFVPLVDSLYPGGLYEGPYARQAAARYESVWLPLLASSPPEEAAALVPPIDVAYAWLCHRLAPTAYAADCQKCFGRALDPSEDQALSFDDGTSHRSARARKAWANMAGAGPYFPPPQPTSVLAVLALAKRPTLSLAQYNTAIEELTGDPKR
jgi:hypothetical protein